jgi:hypothetical protein
VDIYHTGFDDIQLTHFRQMGPLVKAAIESAIANVSIIVLLNGCFDINPVLCSSTVVLSPLKYGMCLRQPPLHIAFIGCILHISV